MGSIQVDRSDGLASSAAIKGPVRLATTVHVAHSGLPVIDGVQSEPDDRVLDKDYDDPAQRGIFVVDNGPWRRAKDFSSNRDLRRGALVQVTEGAINGGFLFTLEAPDPITIGETALTFTGMGLGVSLPTDANRYIRIDASGIPQALDAEGSANLDSLASGELTDTIAAEIERVEDLADSAIVLGNTAITTANEAVTIATAGAIPPRKEVAAGQTSALPTFTYDNGTLGVGATITANSNGALATSVFDNISALSGTPRVWVGLEGQYNGLYDVTNAGSGGAAYVLTRCTDADTKAELHLCIFAVKGGDTLSGRRYQCQQKETGITVGTTALTFALLNDDSAYSEELLEIRTDVTGDEFDSAGERVDDIDQKVLDVLQRLIFESLPDYDFNWWDRLRNSVFGIHKDGSTRVVDLIAIGRVVGTFGTLLAREAEGKAVLFEDKILNRAATIDKTATARFVATDSREVLVNGTHFQSFGPKYGVARFIADIELDDGTGQSLIVGAFSLHCLSTTALYGSLKHSQGLTLAHPTDSGSMWTGFIPLVEKPVRVGFAMNGETPASGFDQFYNELLIHENGLTPERHGHKNLLSISGSGGKTLAELAPGTEYFDNAEDSIDNGYANATALGKTFCATTRFWVHGQQDNADGITVADYKTGLRTNHDAYKAHAAALPNGNMGHEVQAILIQPQVEFAAGPRVQIAMYEMAKEYADMHLAGPQYWAEYYTDNVHLPAWASKITGAYIGLVKKRIIADEAAWKPLMPVEYDIEGDALNIRWHLEEDAGRVVFANDWIAATLNHGQALLEDDEATPINIMTDSVRVIDREWTQIRSADGALSSGIFFRNAFSTGAGTGQSGMGRLVGHRANLRNMAGFIRPQIDLTGGFIWPMHDYSVVVHEQVT